MFQNSSIEIKFVLHMCKCQKSYRIQESKETIILLYIKNI